MIEMYQPPIDNANTTTQTGYKPKPNLAELFKSPEVQEDYAEIASKKEKQGMERVYDRPITILSFEETIEEVSFGGSRQPKNFTKIHFYYSDDENKTPHYCLTQALSLKNALLAIGNERLKKYDGIPTMICVKQNGANKNVYFDGIEWA